jgi:hypothetical protein
MTRSLSLFLALEDRVQETLHLVPFPLLQLPLHRIAPEIVMKVSCPMVRAAMQVLEETVSQWLLSVTLLILSQPSLPRALLLLPLLRAKEEDREREMMQLHMRKATKNLIKQSPLFIIFSLVLW